MTRVIVIGGMNVVANNTRPRVAGLKISLGPMPASLDTSRANEYRKSKGIWEM